MAGKVIVFALVLVAILGMVSAAEPKATVEATAPAGSKEVPAADAPAAKGGAADKAAAGAPSTDAAAAGGPAGEAAAAGGNPAAAAPKSGASALELSAVAGVAAVAGFFVV